jgi:LCP family protein required for cell wall assembly
MCGSRSGATLDRSCTGPVGRRRVPYGAVFGRELRGKPRNWGALRVAVFGAGLLAVLVAIPAVLYVASLDRTVQRNLTRVPDAFPPAELRPPEPADTGFPRPLNILLLGSDQGVSAGQRSDVVMLAHVDSARSEVTVVSLPRDSWVDVPGHGQAKINAAYAFGGFPLAVHTVEQLLGVRIDHVASINLDGFRDITTALGGVDVKVVQPFTDSRTGYDFGVGTHHLSGDLAVAFVRQRTQLEQGDLDRMANQQAFLRALIATVLSRGTLTNPAELSRVLDATTRHVTVDELMTADRMRELAWELRNLRGDDVTFFTAPVAGVGTSPDGQSIVRLDDARLAELADSLRRDAVGDYDPRRAG